MAKERNGTNVQSFEAETSGRAYPVTPDGSQWEIRLHCRADLGAGPEIIGEIVFRSFNGGIAPLNGMIDNGAATAKGLVAKLVKQMEEAQEQYLKNAEKAQTGIQIAHKLPPDRGS